MLQRRPTTAPVITCEKCQIFVPSPITHPSSTYDDSWTKYASALSVTAPRNSGAALPGGGSPAYCECDRRAESTDERRQCQSRGQRGPLHKCACGGRQSLQ